MRRLSMVGKSRRAASTLALALGLAGLAAGCASSPAPPPQMGFVVQSDPKTNAGLPFYLVIRSISDKQFLTDTYQAMAALVCADPPDATVLLAKAILPGKEQEISVDKPTRGSLGLYFLFSESSGQWKRMLSQPLSNNGYKITLSKNRIDVVAKKSFLRRMLWPF